jgi:hypothetical protein
MGEYAIRKCDGQEVKIGTCASMYYMTFRQWAAGDVIGGDTPTKKHLNSIDFRLPRPDEENILVGDFEEYRAKPIPLFLKRYRNKKNGKLYTNTHSDPDYTHYDYEESNFTSEIKEICFDNWGVIQVSAKMKFPHNREKWGFEETAGIHANIPCYHGFTSDKLPEKMGYNGFNTHVLAVMRIAARKDDSGKLKACAVIGCRACGDTVFSVTIDELKENFEVTTSNEQDFYYLLNELEYMQMWIDRNMEG